MKAQQQQQKGYSNKKLKKQKRIALFQTNTKAI